MRNTDDPNPKPLGPLGEKATPKTPASEPEWKQKPDSPGIEVGPDGRLRTNLPMPWWNK